MCEACEPQARFDSTGHLKRVGSVRRPFLPSTRIKTTPRQHSHIFGRNNGDNYESDRSPNLNEAEQSATWPLAICLFTSFEAYFMDSFLLVGIF